MGFYQPKVLPFCEELMGTQMKYIDKTGKERLIGYKRKELDGFVLICPRKAEHFFRNYSGWGLNREAVEVCLFEGFVRIKVVVDDGKKVLVTSPENWKERGHAVQFHGFEPQLILSEVDFDKVVEGDYVGE
jgi:hypothetical protein